MSYEVRPLEERDLEGLGRFLRAGFGAPAGATFASTAVLRWKYLEGDAAKQPRSYVAVDEAGAVVGHLGAWPTAFEGAAVPGGRVRTLHMMDWLGSDGHRAVGVSLMRRANHGFPTQFGVGGSLVARTVAERTGYELRDQVPVYRRMLRPDAWLRDRSQSLGRRWLLAVRDGMRGLLRGPRRSRLGVELKRVAAFGDEVGRVAERAGEHAILTTRSPSRLDHLLRFPGGAAITGWHIHIEGRLRGFALLTLLPRDGSRPRLGIIADCLLDDADPAAWHAAFLALTAELSHQGAEVVQTFASTPWIVSALGRSGYAPRFSLDFHLRDRRSLLPRGVPFHFMPIEADYAYT